MLKITILDSAAELRFRLEGRLCGAWVGELRQCWHTASSTLSGRNAVLDLHEVDFIDPDGQRLLSQMHDEGVQIVAETPLIRSIVDEVCKQFQCGTVERMAAPADVFHSTRTTG